MAYHDDHIKYELVIFNAGGASEITGHVTKKEVKLQIRSWSDPWTMIAHVINVKTRVTLYDGPALGFK